MTQFEHLELIYNQFINLTKEIDAMIASESYESVVAKLKYKDKLIKKLLLTRKTVKPTEEQLKKLNYMEEKIRKDEHQILASLKIRHKEIAEELNKTKKKIKINSAYDSNYNKKQGSIIDISD